MNKLILIILSIFVFSGCAGYKPSSYYTKQEISKKVFVKLNINISNAQNSVLIKDAMNEMIVGRFGSKLVNNENEAQTVINLSLGSVSLSAIQYDSNGYVSVYRASISIKVNYKANGFIRNITVSDYYDFAVESDATISDTKKDEAIRIAASKALEDVLSKIAIQTFK
ncbi:MAG: hypothetical protein HOH31_01645 [Campylobacteraceae bacterium]|jgi:hypothetical protein|nr:hypothetical protein [Campylobacteraceae bacterium]MBT4178736.1 hypothetical protein [Campylobacteraceae bacterium]MBT4572099.1 hypothetical protein [Campylobacteraceae bacterium]MBT4708598.1 hypothetical protein [Campylobacteraceae bacterium]MBT6107274.1 hypothetical protein [Campylobacteraceae bacterium]